MADDSEGPERGSYLVGAGADEGIVAQVPTDVGRDDLTVDAIAGDEVLVLARRSKRRLRRRAIAV
jgi:hypothetical protein